MEKPTIVLTDPKPLPKDEKCPGCRAGKERRVPSCGFGVPHPICGQCGHEFVGERWAS